jgi:hypothetical protein
MTYLNYRLNCSSSSSNNSNSNKWLEVTEGWSHHSRHTKFVREPPDQIVSSYLILLLLNSYLQMGHNEMMVIGSKCGSVALYPKKDISADIGSF